MKTKINKNLQTEVDACYLYNKLAEVETDPIVTNIFKQMAEIEMSHAMAFLNKINPDSKSTLPPPSFRAKTFNLIGKVFGYDYVLGILMDTEKGISTAIINTKNKNNIPISGTETNHVKILRNILAKDSNVSGQTVARFEKRFLYFKFYNRITLGSMLETQNIERNFEFKST